MLIKKYFKLLFTLLSCFLIPKSQVAATITVDEYIRRYRLPTGTKFQITELRYLLQEFLLNAHRDLYFTRQQFMDSYQQYYPNGDGTYYCNYLFNAFDSNGSGYIEFPEFVNVLSLIHRSRFRQRATLGFHVYDLIWGQEKNFEKNFFQQKFFFNFSKTSLSPFLP